MIYFIVMSHVEKQFQVSFNKEAYPCFFIDDKDKALELIDKLILKEGILAADLETARDAKWQHIPTAALSPHLSTPRLLQLFTGTGVAVIDLWATGKIDLSPLFHKRPSVFHNVTFDYKMLRKHHNVIEPDMHCTCIMARMVFHAIYADDKKADLKSVTKMFFGETLNKQAGASDWSEPLTFEQIRYAAMDVLVLMELYKKLDAYIDQLNLRRVYDLYRKAQLVLSEMELNGICVDKQKHLKNIVKWRDELHDAAEDVLKTTGLDRISDTKIGGWLEKSLPPETLAIWPRTEKDERLSTDANTLIDFSHIDLVKPFSRYQKVKKLTTSFGMKFLDFINPETGKLHPTYRVAGAKTGRLSCAEPNIQQAPRDKSFRAVFVPSPGYVLVVADYGQIEIRIGAELSRDVHMLKVYEEGKDLYRYTASQLTGKSYNEISKTERQSAKALCLGLQFMLGWRKFSKYARKGYGVEISEKDSRALIDNYRELYPQLREWQLNQTRQCELCKYSAYTIMGKSRKMTEETYYAACVNHPIQGSAAEVLLLALINIHQKIKGTSATMLATVHDEILLQCLPNDVEKVEKLLADAMTEAYFELFPSGKTLRNLVEPSHGFDWANAKEAE